MFKRGLVGLGMIGGLFAFALSASLSGPAVSVSSRKHQVKAEV